MGGSRLTHCCCGCSLRDGSVSIGYVYAVMGFFGSVGSCVLLNQMAKEDELTENARFLGISGAVSGLIQMVVSILLIYGGYKEKTGYLIPWIVYGVNCFILGKIALIILLILIINGHTYLTSVACAITLNNLLYGYFVNVVNSYRKSLQENSENKHPSSDVVIITHA